MERLIANNCWPIPWPKAEEPTLAANAADFRSFARDAFQYSRAKDRRRAVSGSVCRLRRSRFDPPYASDYGAVLNYVGDHATRFLAERGVMIVEHDKKKELRKEFGQLLRYRVVKQGDSALSFHKRPAA